MESRLNILETLDKFKEEVATDKACLLTIAQAISDLNETIKERFPLPIIKIKIVCIKCGRIFLDTESDYSNSDIKFYLDKYTKCDNCSDGEIKIYKGFINDR